MTQPTDKRTIKLIVVDLDGTLLNSAHQVSDRNEKAIKAALAQGVQVAFATGKTYLSAARLFEQLDFKAPGIFVQGLTLYDADGKITHQSTLNATAARQIITFAEDRGFFMLAYSGSRIVARRHDAKIFDEMAKYHETIEAVGALQNMLGEMPVNKLVAIGADARSAKALRWQLGVQHEGVIRTVQAGIPNMVEILPPGVSKGSALKLLTKDLRIAPENVLAMGDAENDIEMLQFAGVGVAMGHADAKVKEAADDIAPTNDEDGVAVMIEKYVLPAPIAEKVQPQTQPSADAKKASAPATTPLDELAETPDTGAKPS
jgi:hypothetical protein